MPRYLVDFRKSCSTMRAIDADSMEHAAHIADELLGSDYYEYLHHDWAYSVDDTYDVRVLCEVEDCDSELYVSREVVEEYIDDPYTQETEGTARTEGNDDMKAICARYEWSVDTFKRDFESAGIEPPTDDECAELVERVHERIDNTFFDITLDELIGLRREKLNALVSFKSGNNQ